jgi:hypothetical protein
MAIKGVILKFMFNLQPIISLKAPKISMDMSEPLFLVETTLQVLDLLIVIINFRQYLKVRLTAIKIKSQEPTEPIEE